MAKVSLSVHKLLELQQALQKLAGLPFPANIALRIGRLILKLNPEFEAVNQQRVKLCRQFGEEKDGKFIFPPEKAPKFEAAIQPLLEETIAIEVEPLEMWMFDGIKQLTPLDMMALEPFIQNKPQEPVRKRAK